MMTGVRKIRCAAGVEVRMTQILTLTLDSYLISGKLPLQLLHLKNGIKIILALYGLLYILSEVLGHSKYSFHVPRTMHKDRKGGHSFP